MEYMSTEIRSAREAMTIFKILGIKDITTERQRKNGTQVFELPIHQMYQSLIPKPLRFATYKAGYVRNVSPHNSSPYQINKIKIKRHILTPDLNETERILIPNWEERLIYLAKFIIKNYYQKPTYLMNDYTIKCLKEAYHKQNKTGLPFGIEYADQADDIQVIINGHKYNLS